MNEYNIINIKNFEKVSTRAESPELALIGLHAESVGDVNQHRYNDYLKGLSYNGRNIGLGNFVFFTK